MDQKIKKHKKLSDNLRQLRYNHDISQEGLCAQLQLLGCDLTRSTYAKYENNLGNVRVDVLVALKTFYNCDYADFFEGIEIYIEE